MDKNSEPNVAVVITNYNGLSIKYKGKSILWHTITSLLKTNYDNYHVVFADDSSSDGSADYVRTAYPGITVIVNSPNGGYTKNANNGIKHALKKFKPDYVLTLNNDVILKDRDWLQKLVDAAEDDKLCGIAGPKLLYPDGRLQQAGITSIGALIRNRGWNTRDAKIHNKTEKVSAVGGVAQLIRRSVISKIGLLDENFFMGSDDVEYCIRASKAGFKILYVGASEVTHLEGFTSKKVSGSKGPDYWFPIFQTNNMYLAFKHFSTIQVLESICITLVSSVVGIGNRKLSITGLRLKNRVFWRLFRFSYSSLE